MNESVLDAVREKLSKKISPKRFEHTLGVEREIGELCKIYLPDRAVEMKLAALLHDITKECTPSEHISFLEKHGIPIPESYRRTPKLSHHG